MGRKVLDKSGRTRWLTFEVAHEGHLDEFHEKAREADQREVSALDPSGLKGNIGQSLRNQEASNFAVLEDGQTIAMFGFVPTTATHACAWFLSSEAIYQYPKTFMELSRIWLDAFARQGYALFNVVWKENTRSIRWLKALGWEEKADMPDLGLHGEDFVMMTYNPMSL